MIVIEHHGVALSVNQSININSSRGKSRYSKKTNRKLKKKKNNYREWKLEDNSILKKVYEKNYV